MEPATQPSSTLVEEVSVPNSWVQDIVSAFENLGGKARYGELYEEVSRIRSSSLPQSWQAIVRQSVESHSSDSQVFKGDDLFYSVEGIGSGHWGLRDYLLHTPHAIDLEEPQEAQKTKKIKTESYRILRDTSLARTVKALHESRCQMCGTALPLSDGSSYAEAHHIRPLGSPHNGPDIEGNILVLCPNHHALCDLRAIHIRLDEIRLHRDHKLSEEFVEYHNALVAGN
jgi:hypothetical protein